VAIWVAVVWQQLGVGWRGVGGGCGAGRFGSDMGYSAAANQWAMFDKISEISVIKANSHIPCSSHAVPMLFPCHAVPVRV
jgi:hypothetical protein